MNEGLSPEERLLKLIKEGVNVSPKARPAEQAVSAPAVSRPPPQRTDIKKFFTITNINKLLIALFSLVLLYAVYGLSSLISPANKELNIQEKAPSVLAKEKTISQQPLTYYMQEIEKRDLFKSVILDDTNPGGQTQYQPTKVRMEELTKSLILKGIIAGNEPQAVIEDTKAGKTYFVIKQDKIGEVNVDDIKADRVRLRLDGQTFELVL